MDLYLDHCLKSFVIGKSQSNRAPVHLESCPGKDWPGSGYTRSVKELCTFQLGFELSRVLF